MVLLPKEKAVDDGPECGVRLAMSKPPASAGQRLVGPAAQQRIAELIDGDQHLFHRTFPDKISDRRTSVSSPCATR